MGQNLSQSCDCLSVLGPNEYDKRHYNMEIYYDDSDSENDYRYDTDILKLIKKIEKEKSKSQVLRTKIKNEKKKRKLLIKECSDGVSTNVCFIIALFL